MARHDDAAPLSDVLDTVANDGLKKLLRDVVCEALQELTGEELTSAICTAKHEHTETRIAGATGRGTGSCRPPPRTWSWKSRSFVRQLLPELFEPRRRVDRALWAVS